MTAFPLEEAWSLVAAQAIGWGPWQSQSINHLRSGEFPEPLVVGSHWKAEDAGLTSVRNVSLHRGIKVPVG